MLNISMAKYVYLQMTVKYARNVIQTFVGNISVFHLGNHVVNKPNSI